MRIKRIEDICIVCLKNPMNHDGADFTEEHVIPASLGGILTCDFLCQQCNSNFGSGFEGKAKTTPALRKAMDALGDDLPDLNRRFQNNQPMTIHTQVGRVKAKIKNGKIVGQIQKLDNGDLLVPDELTHLKLKEFYRICNGSNKNFENSWTRWLELPKGQSSDFTSNIKVTKHKAYALPNYQDSSDLNPLVCLKIAYEFAYIIFGSGVLSDNPNLNEIRRCLQEQNSESWAFSVESLEASDYKPFHGILFEGNDPYSKFQIRLFGKLAYRVHLPNLRFDHEPVCYTHNLISNEDEMETLPEIIRV